MDALAPELAEALQPRVRRLGYLGEFFRCAAHQPQALLSFMRFTDDLKQALPDDLTEVVALTVASLLSNNYERHQHERLSRTLGFSDVWIRDASRIVEDAESTLTAEQRAVQTLAGAVVTRTGHGAAAELDAVVSRLGPATAMALLLLIGRTVTHALVVNTLALSPPVPSIFPETP
jgi:alkylhydroperoxidase family enzyme